MKHLKTLLIFYVLSIFCLAGFLILPTFATVQPDYEVRTANNPFLQSQVNIQANTQNCSISIQQHDYIMVLEADKALTTLTAHDNFSNSYTTPSTADYTFLQAPNGVLGFGVDLEYHIFFAVANGNGTDIISLSATPSTMGSYCADIGNINSTGWETTPTLPIFAIGNIFNGTQNTRQVSLNSQVGDYAGGLAFTWIFTYATAQQQAIAITPNQPFNAQCFVGAPATCSHLELDSGAVSFNYNIAHSIGGENIQNVTTISFPAQSACLSSVCASRGLVALISFPTPNSCLPSKTKTCVEGNTGFNNTPINFDIASFTAVAIIPLIFIFLPSFILGALGKAFGAGIYGFVFGAIGGDLTGVLAHVLDLWTFIVMLYGALLLFYLSGSSGSFGGRADEQDEFEFEGE